MFEYLVVNNKLISNALWLHKLAQKFLSPNTTQVLSHQPRHQPYLPSPSAFNTIRIIQHHPHLYLVSFPFLSFLFLSFFFSFFFTVIRVCSLPTHPHANASARQRICTPTHPYANAFACQCSI